jgi:hypothetical protein
MILAHAAQAKSTRSATEREQQREGNWQIVAINSN